MMKMLRNLILISFLALFISACGGNDRSGHDHDGHDAEMSQPADKDKTGPEYTSVYVCPMHCDGSGSDEPGECPVCGMDYVKNENL